MYTKVYKSVFFIHCYSHTKTCHMTFSDGMITLQLGEFKSEHAAKLAATKKLKKLANMTKAQLLLFGL